MKEFQTFDEMGPLTKATLIGRRFAKRCHIFFASHPWARRVSVVLAMALVVWVNWVPSPNRTASRKLDARYAQLPLSFEVNQGQSDAQVKFLQRGGGHAVYLTERGEPVLIFKGRQHGNGRAKAPGLPFRVAQEERTLLALRISFVGGNPSPAVEGVEKLPGTSNYLIGNDPSQWRTGIPHYAKVRYRDVFPGVDLTYYGKDGKLEYDFEVRPGSDPSSVRMRVHGAKTVEVSPLGNLVARTGNGAMILHKPSTYQEVEGTRREVASAIEINEQGEVHFRIGEYDPTKTLLIDPVVSYSTKFADVVRGIATDGAGNSYLVGTSSSTSFQAVPGAFQSSNAGSDDVFIAKLDATGSQLVYATYLGGTSSDIGTGIAVDGSGNAYVTGYTGSTNFPVLNAFQATHAGLGTWDAFVTKLNASGSQLLYSTQLGGASDDTAWAIALDGFNNAYVTGSTYSTGFPTTVGAVQTVKGTSSDVIVSKLDPTQTGAASLIYSTFLGGSGDENGTGIAVDSAGSAFVTGYTTSSNFPTVNPGQPTCKSCSTGNADAFVSKLNAAGSAQVYATFLGGSNGNYGYGIAVDSTTGNAYVTGTTYSANFPTTVGAYQTSLKGGSDAFVTKINASGATLLYSTFLGGSDYDNAAGIAIDGSGNAYLTGSTSSTNFPVVAPIQATSGGGSCSYYGYSYQCSDAIVPQLNATGTGLLFSTYLGGSGNNYGNGIALDSGGNAYVAGQADPGFPITPGALQTASGFGFVVKISFVAAPGIAFSSSSLSFGMQGTGTTSAAQTIVLSNVGSATLDITSIVPSGDFAKSSTCGPTVAGGGVCSIDVTFSPTALGALTGSLVITHSGAGSPATINLSGTGVAPPVVALSPTSLDFGNQPTSPPFAMLPVTLTNTGGFALSITNKSISGDFAMTDNCGTSVVVNGSCVFNVTFGPTALGTRNGTLTISDNAAGSPHSVALTGVGVGAPAVSLSSNSLTFGLTVLNATSPTQTVTLTNTGATTLTIASMTLGGTNGTDFTRSDNCGASVAAGANCTITLAFRPTAIGIRSGTLSINSNASGSPHNVALSGQGADFNISPSGGSPTTATVSAGGSTSFTLTLGQLNGFSGNVAMSCTTSSAVVTCSVPASAAVPGNVVVNVTATSQAWLPFRGLPPENVPTSGANVALGWTLALLAMGTMWRRLRKQNGWAHVRARRAVALTAILLCAQLCTGCGGGGGGSRAARTYTITVNAATSGVTHSTTLTVVVP